MVDTRFYEQCGPFSLDTLLSGLSAEILDPKFNDEMISGVSALELSQPGDISFLGSAKHKASLETARATACFVPEKLASLVSTQHIIPIISAAPRAHFARALSALFTIHTLENSKGDAKIAKTAHIHKSVVIGAGAVIADGVHLAPNVVIGPGVHVGTNTRVGPNVVIECAVIGANCSIKAGAVIGGAGFGIAHDERGSIDIPHIGRVIMGDGVSVGSQTCIDRGQINDTIIQDGVKIDNLVQIAHNVVIGSNTVVAGHVGIAGSCIIGKNVQLGGNAGMVDHVTIGDGASVAARAGVMHDIPAGEVWSGIPALPIRDHMRMINATRKLGVPKKKRDGK